MGNLHLQLSVSEHTCSGAALVPPAPNTRGFFINLKAGERHLFLVFSNDSDSVQLNDAFDYHPGGQNMAWFQQDRVFDHLVRLHPAYYQLSEINLIHAVAILIAAFVGTTNLLPIRRPRALWESPILA